MARGKGLGSGVGVDISASGGVRLGCGDLEGRAVSMGTVLAASLTESAGLTGASTPPAQPLNHNDRMAVELRIRRLLRFMNWADLVPCTK